MAQPVVVQCPKCSQKYRLPPEKIGRRARCRCGQRFTITNQQPVDEETIFGWVVDDADPMSKSVLGGTGILDSPFTKFRPKQVVDVIQAGVRLDHIDEHGGHFEFSAGELTNGRLRESFPKQCVSCSHSRDLLVYVVVWVDKIRGLDRRQYQDQHGKLIGKLKDLTNRRTAYWLDDLPHQAAAPKPFSLPLPFYGCAHCSISDEVSTAVFTAQGLDYCQLRIANLEVAVKFYRNNGCPNAEDLERLIQARAAQKADHWQALPSAVRRHILDWHRKQQNERFEGFFPDRDFSKADAGKAGLLLTDQRLCYHKFTSSREYAVRNGGRLYLQPDAGIINVRIVQKGKKDSVVHLAPDNADQLVSALRQVGHAWKISGNVGTYYSK